MFWTKATLYLAIAFTVPIAIRDSEAAVVSPASNVVRPFTLSAWTNATGALVVDSGSLMLFA